MFCRRLHDTVALIICSLTPKAAKSLYGTIERVNFSEHYITYNIALGTKKISPFLSDSEYTASQDGTVRLFFPHGMPPAAPFILFRLKRRGFSDCRVTVTDGGLLVTASR
jgi:hypothetical protein